MKHEMKHYFASEYPNCSYSALIWCQYVSALIWKISHNFIKKIIPILKGVFFFLVFVFVLIFFFYKSSTDTKTVGPAENNINIVINASVSTFIPYVQLNCLVMLQKNQSWAPHITRMFVYMQPLSMQTINFSQI